MYCLHVFGNSIMTALKPWPSRIDKILIYSAVKFLYFAMLSLVFHQSHGCEIESECFSQRSILSKDAEYMHFVLTITSPKFEVGNHLNCSLNHLEFFYCALLKRSISFK